MKVRKRSKNFTEREKRALMELAKKYESIIENKKTDTLTNELKKEAWMAITTKYNANSITGFRTEKQLHVLYDLIKRTEGIKVNDEKCDTCNIESGIYGPEAVAVDGKIVLTPQSITMSNQYTESSSPCRDLPNEADSINGDPQPHSIFGNILSDVESTTNMPVECSSPTLQNKDVTDSIKRKEIHPNETQNIDDVTSSIIKRKNRKQKNEDAVTKKKLEILELQRRQEVMKLQKTKILFNLDIQLKKVLLQNAKLDLYLKRKASNVQFKNKDDI